MNTQVQIHDKNKTEPYLLQKTTNTQEHIHNNNYTNIGIQYYIMLQTVEVSVMLTQKYKFTREKKQSNNKQIQTQSSNKGTTGSWKFYLSELFLDTAKTQFQENPNF